MRAAQALEKVITERDSESVVEIIDGLEYVNHYFNKVVVDGYKFSATKIPKLYGLVYRAANKDSRIYKIVQKTNSFFARKILPLVAEFKPDVMVTTHPFMSIMCSRLREKGITNIPLVSIITDFASHNAYINPGVTDYIVSSIQMVDELEKIGVDRNTVHPVGIPIDPIFFEKDENKEEHLRELGFDPSLKTVLIMAGSFGVTDILKIYENINEIDLDFQIIVITGRNKKLFDAFNSILACNENMRVGQAQPNFNEDKEPSRREEKLNITKKTKLIFFTDEVHRYMHISDLIITKPGGLTVTEALASCLPMALFRGIPGQETDNSEYLSNNNLAVCIKKSDVSEKIYQLLKYPERLLSMRESCKRLNNKDSAYNVYDIIKNAVDSMGDTATINDISEVPFMADEFDEESIVTEFREFINKYKDETEGFDFSDDEMSEEEQEKMTHFKELFFENLRKFRNHENSFLKDFKNNKPKV